MRVLHLISEMGVGGAESLVVEMVTRGEDFGWDSSVASGGGVKADQLSALGVQSHFVPPVRRSVRGLTRARAAAVAAMREASPDVVVAHNVSASLVAWAARPGVPIVSVFHGVADSDYRNAARILARTSVQTVVVAQSVAHRLRDAGLTKRPVYVIPNAVSVPDPIDRLQARHALNIDAQVPVALCLARMEPQKRHDVLLDAWQQLADGELLLLAGDGSQRTALEARAAALGDRVRFLGRRSDVAQLLAAADISVLTSDWEGMPMAILESLAASRPVVATDVDGVREILSSGGGRLVPAGDADSVACAVRDLLCDSDARTTAASQGLATVRNRYDAMTMVKSYDEVLRGALHEMEA